VQRVDVRIGVTQVPREIEVELADDTDVEKLTASIESSLASAEGVLWLTDRRGRRVGVPAGKLAYVEFNVTGDERRVGFGAGRK
jgi:hypothetical protein